MRRDINQEDRQWLELHAFLKCNLTIELKEYGVVDCYNLSSNKDSTHFYGNFILIFKDDTLEDWSVSDINALSALVKGKKY